MRHMVVISVLLAVTAAGCLSPSNPALPGNSTSNKTQSGGFTPGWDAFCEAGTQPFFVDRTPFGGLVYVGPGTSWSATAIGHDGLLEVARGSASPLGNGTVEYNGSLEHENVSTETVKAMLVEAGLYSKTKDYVVQFSANGTPGLSTLTKVCSATSAVYKAANSTIGACPDLGSVDWGLSTQVGNKTMAYPACKEPAEVQNLSVLLDNATREATGI
ncbi:MAG: hypothetical protein ACYDDF_13955 [Thermoplasmatota archaeon]